jgi:hypothetical protein
MLHKSEKRGVRRVLVTIPILALGYAATNLGSVALATFVPTTTTLSASPTSTIVGQSVTLTATVTPTGLLAGSATDQGNVQFSVNNTALGSPQALSGCQAGKACSTSLTTTALPVGHDSLTATYTPSGGLTAGSTSQPVFVDVSNPPPPPLPTATPANPQTANCTGGTNCEDPTVYATDTSSSIDVVTTGGTTGAAYTDSESLGGTTLSCQGSAAQVGNYNVSDSTVAQTITYQLLGQYADAFNNAHPTNTFQVCYGSPSTFAGSTFNAANNDYEGFLPACNGTASNSPCEKSQTYSANGGPNGVSSETFVITVNPNTTAGGNGTGNTCSNHSNNPPTNCKTTDPHVGGP